MAIHVIPTNFDAVATNEAGRHATPVPPPPGEEVESLYWGDDGLGFDDVLDVVNPLHHLPVVGTAYREMTGDEIAPAAKMIGGLIFGGPLGLVFAIVNAIFEEATGKEFGTAVAEIFTGDDEDTARPTQLAAVDEGKSAGAGGPDAATPAPTDTPAQTVALAASAAPPPPPAPAALPQLAPAGATPQLSPQAFDALVRSFNGPIERAAPQPAPTAATAATTGAIRAQPNPAAEAATATALPALAPAPRPAGKPVPLLRGSGSGAVTAHDDRRQAALDLHQQLRAYAEDKGVTVAARPAR